MPFSDLPDDILLKIATCIDQEWSTNSVNTWRSFAALDSRCREAALTARLAIAKRYIAIKDHSDETVKALAKPTFPFLKAIRKLNLHVGTLNVSADTKDNSSLLSGDEYTKTFSHLILLLTICSKLNLHTLRLTGYPYTKPGPFPMQVVVTILMLMKRLLRTFEIETVLHPDPDPNTGLRVLKLEQISWPANFSFKAADVLSGLEVLHINWCEGSLSRKSKSRYSPPPAARVGQMMARFVRVSRKSLKSLKLDFGGNECAMRGFDVRMLGASASDEDHDDDDEGEDEHEHEHENENEKDDKVEEEDGWKQLTKLRLTIDVDRTKSISPMGKDLVGTLEAIAEMFPNLGTLELILEPHRYYYDMVKYTPEILKPLSKLKNLHHLSLSLDFECDSKDELEEDHDLVWYNRCLHRRYAATQEIAKVCPNLRRCYWKHHCIDSEGNSQWHFFIIEDSKEDDLARSVTDSNGQKIGVEPAGSGRVVKTKMRWWMEEDLEEFGELPGEVVGPVPGIQNGYEGLSSDSDESVSFRTECRK